MGKNSLPVFNDTQDPELSKRERYYNFVRQSYDDYENISFSSEEKQKVEKHLRKLSTGSSAAAPLICRADQCPFKANCPYWQIGKAPLNKPCLVEAQLLQHWLITYMEEYQVDPDSFTEVGFCNELAEIEILLYRLNQILARPENAELTIEQTIAISKEGLPIVQTHESPYLVQKERLSNRRAKIIKLMVGDRQEKYKKESALKVKESKDSSTRQAEVKREIEALQRNVRRLAEKTPEESDILTPDQIIANED